MTALNELKSTKKEQPVNLPEEGMHMADTEKQPEDGLPVPQAIEVLHELTDVTIGDVTCSDAFITAEKVNVYYGDNHAIKDVSLEIGRGQVVA